MKVEEVISKLKGIPCQETPLARTNWLALEEYMAGLTAYESAVEETAVAE